MSFAAPTPARGQFDSFVSVNQPLCREHFRLTLRLPDFPPTLPGQFVQLACVDDQTLMHESRDFDYEALRDRESADIEYTQRTAVLRRPFSLAGRRDTADGVELDVIARTVGIGTDWLSKLRAGDRVSIIGPLGNAFTLPAPGGIALLVGGGVGVPPMIYLAEALAKANRRGVVCSGVVFCGAMSRDLLPLSITGESSSVGEPRINVEEFARHNISAVLTTDDGSLGFKGFVTQALEKYLETRLSPGDRAGAIIYTCGPEPMMKAAAALARKYDISCQVCVERAMACGMGTCQSCCIKVLKPDPALPPLAGSDWCYRLACTDGPVFEARKLIW